MIKKVKEALLTNLLFKGSLILFFGSGVASFGMYLFHLLMGRLLGPEDYGLLSSLISLSYFLGVPLGIFALVITKFVSQNSDPEKSGAFVAAVSKVMALVGAIVLVLFLSLFPLLKNLVRVGSFWPYLGLGVFSYLAVFVTICSSCLQGLMKFERLSWFGIFNSWAKLGVAFLMVAAGFKVGGAILGLVLGTLLTVVFGFFFLYKEFNFFKPAKKIGLKKVFKDILPYTTAVFFCNVSLTCLYTTDIILARHFLSPLEAGYYAALSSLGKIIFFASSPIISVMFPIVSSKQSLGRNYRQTVFLSLVLVGLVSAGILSLYFLAPGLMVSLLYGRQYLDISENLGFFGVFIFFYTLSSLLMNFYLSISQTKIIFLPVVLAVFQIVLIGFFHGSVARIIWINILISTILTAGLLLYSLKYLGNTMMPNIQAIKKARLEK